MAVRAAARHLTPGTALPRIALIATGGTQICLAALPGRSIVVVYPWTGRPGLPDPPGWDDIPGAHGSTPELEGFRDLMRRFTAYGAHVFGLSGQDTAHQREAVARLRLPFPLLSDRHAAFADALRLPRFTAGAETYLTRLTLVVRNGRIETVFDPVSDPAGHAAQVLSWLERETGPAQSPIASSSASSTE